MGTLLIIDGDAASVQDLRTALVEREIDLKIIADGNESIEWANQNQPTCILLSIEMPRGSGYSICNRLRKDPGTLEIPLILASGQAGEDTITQHQQLKTHADHYVKKPYDLKNLLPILAVYFPKLKPLRAQTISDTEETIGMPVPPSTRPQPISEERTAMLSDRYGLKVHSDSPQGGRAEQRSAMAQDFFAEQLSTPQQDEQQANANKTIVAQGAPGKSDGAAGIAANKALPDESTCVDDAADAPALSRLASQDMLHQNKMLNQEVGYLREKIQSAEKELGRAAQQHAQSKKIAQDSQTQVQKLSEQMQGLQSQSERAQRQLEELRAIEAQLREQSQQLRRALDKSEQQRQELEQAQSSLQGQYQAEQEKLSSLQQTQQQMNAHIRGLRDEQEVLKNTHAGVRQSWGASRVALDQVIEKMEELVTSLRSA